MMRKSQNNSTILTEKAAQLNSLMKDSENAVSVITITIDRLASVNDLPAYFFTVPASSSGKYHPSYALGDGGLVRHTKAAVSIAHELFDLEMFPFTNDEQDLIILSLILHDGLKQGDGNGKRTVFDHPILAANFVKRCNFESQLLTDEQEAFVVNAIESHMGQWNTSKYSKVELPKPKNKFQKYVHLCDYLASRKYLEFDFESI